MNICFLMYNPFKFGGIERIVSKLANELVIRGYNVTILCLEKVNIDRSIYGLKKEVNIICCKQLDLIANMKILIHKLLCHINRKTKLLKNNVDILEIAYIHKNKFFLKEIKQIINDNNFDYVIGVNGFFSLILAYLKKEVKCKCIGWQHSTYDAYFHTKGFYYYNQEKLFKKYISKLDKYIVLTQEEKNIVDSNFNIDSIVIANMCSFENQNKSTLKKKELLSVGRLVYSKGFDMLIEIFYEFSKKNKDWNLKIIGDGPEKKKLQKLINEYNLQDRITILPFTKNIQNIYLNSSIMLITSRWEGFGMVAIEAMEFGLPILSFDIPSMNELSCNNKYFELVDCFNIQQFSDKLYRYIKDDKLLNKYSTLSKMRAQDFYSSKVIKKWEKLLK